MGSFGQVVLHSILWAVVIHNTLCAGGPSRHPLCRWSFTASFEQVVLYGILWAGGPSRHPLCRWSFMASFGQILGSMWAVHTWISMLFTYSVAAVCPASSETSSMAF